MASTIPPGPQAASLDPGSARRLLRERLLNDVVGSVRDPLGAAGGRWLALILDETTTRVVSSCVRMHELSDAGVGVVEDLSKAREPLPVPAIYFIAPTPQSVARLCADFPGGGQPPRYPSAHVFFSSRVPTEAIERVRQCAPLVAALRTLKEVNAEVVAVDGRTVVTGHPHALARLFGERAGEAPPSGGGGGGLGGRLGSAPISGPSDYDRELDSIAGRLACLFATLREFPSVRYRAGRPPEPNDPPGSDARALLTQRLATRVSERCAVLQRSGLLPSRETCDLLVLDRSIDPVAPLIHDWGYEALVYDVVPSIADSGGVAHFSSEDGAGRATERDHRLDDGGDALWAETRHAHVADVYASLARRFADFQQRNRAARYQQAQQQQAGGAGGGGAGAGGAGAGGGGGGQGGRGGGAAMSAAGMRQLVAALPQFRDGLALLSAHVWVSSEVQAATKARRLDDVGMLEQELVYGEKNSQDLVKFLAENAASLAPEDRVRLIACYVATHPEKLDAAKAAQWARLARLAWPVDLAPVLNLAFLGVPVMKPEAAAAAQAAAQAQQAYGGAPAAAPQSALSALGLASLASRAARVGGGGKKKATYTRRPCRDADGGYALAAFDPVLLAIGEDAAAGRLPQDEYPHVRPPGGGGGGGGGGFGGGGFGGGPSAAAASAAQADDDPGALFGGDPVARAASARTNRSGLNWARPGPLTGGLGGGATGGVAGVDGSGLPRTSGLAGGSALLNNNGTSVTPPPLPGAPTAAPSSSRRLVIFVIGGVTRGEVRAAHALARLTGRDVTLASTSVLRPSVFLGQLAQLGTAYAV